MSMALAITADRPAQGAWIDLAEAARRSGKSLGQLRRLAGDVWAGKGLAQLVNRGKGRPTWMIRDDADASLARVKMADAIGLDLSGLTDRQRETALLRKSILEAWSNAIRSAFDLGYGREAATGQFLQLLSLGKAAGIPQAMEVSRATLFNWQAKFQAGGLANLADGRGGSIEEKQAESDDPFFAFVRQAYLTPKKMKLAQVHKFALMQAEMVGWEVRSYKACQRMINAIPKPVVLRAREGDKKMKDVVDAYIERDYSSLATNEIWCADHHRLDVICERVDGNGEVKYFRPWLSAFMDVRSRVLVGWKIFDHDPNSDVILRAFAAGATERGLPKIVQVDNGKDYDSRALQGVTKKQRRDGSDPNVEANARVLGAFRSLDVEVKHVWPYHGQSKPIERFFGSVCDRFSRLFDTYCGGSTATRPADLAKQIKSGKAPTMAEVDRGFSEWLQADYHHRAHLGDGMTGRTPEQVFTECLVGSSRKIAPSIIWFACLPRVGPVVYGQAGVTWRGMHWGGFDTELKNQLFGQKVYLAVDKDNAGRAFVIDLQGRLLGEVRSNTRMNFHADEQTVREGIAAKKAAVKATRAAAKQRPTATMDLGQIVADMAAKKAMEAQQAAKGASPEPESVAIIQTPFNASFAAVQRAFEGQSKQAVGAESVPFPSIASSRFVYGSGGDNQDIETPADGGMVSFRELMDQQANSQQEES